MQVFVRDHCTMIAAPVQCDVDGIPKRSHYVRVPIAIGRHNLKYLEFAADFLPWLKYLATSWIMVYPTPLTSHFVLFYKSGPGPTNSLVHLFGGICKEPCAVSRKIVSSAKLRELWRGVLGQPTYLAAKANVEKSMLVKR